MWAKASLPQRRRRQDQAPMHVPADRLHMLRMRRCQRAFAFTMSAWPIAGSQPAAQLPNSVRKPCSGAGPAVWIAHLPAADALNGIRDLLGCEEWAVGTQFRVQGDRERYLAGRALLRQVLSDCTEGMVAPAQWRFQYDALGKPRVAPGLPQIHFSLAHAGRLVVVATDPAQPVGVDVERLCDFAPDHIPTDCLSTEECIDLTQCAKTTRAAAFLRLWTLKEAYAKQTGMGVSADFGEIEIIQHSDGCFGVRTDEQVRLASCAIALREADYRISVAHRHGSCLGRSVYWHIRHLTDGDCGTDAGAGGAVWEARHAERKGSV